jgi:hypothetical protein
MNASTGRLLVAGVIGANVALFAFSPLGLLQNMVNTSATFVAGHLRDVPDATAAAGLVVGLEALLSFASLVTVRAVRRTSSLPRVEAKLYIGACLAWICYNALFALWFLALWLDND